jgi:hypothetical protein
MSLRRVISHDCSLMSGTLMRWLETIQLGPTMGPTALPTLAEGPNAAASEGLAKDTERRAKGEKAKRAAVEDVLKICEKIREVFVSKNARSWSDLPGHNLLVNSGEVHLAGFPLGLPTEQFPSKMKPKPTFSVMRASSGYRRATEEQQDGLLELFEVVWRGDVQAIKTQTLGRWGPDKKKDPLPVAVATQGMGITLIMVALKQKRIDLVKLILQIAKAQFRPKDAKVNFYVERNEYSEDEDEDGDYYIASETIDDTFELGDVAQIPDEARSDVSPLDLLRRSITMRTKLIDEKSLGKLQKHNLANQPAALTLTIIEDDFDTFVKLLNLADEFDESMH